MKNKAGYSDFNVSSLGTRGGCVSFSVAYLQDGEKVEVLLRTEHGVIVRRLYGSDDREPSAGEPEVVGRVFDTPPIARREKRIEELEERERQIMCSIREKQRELADLESNKKRIEALAAKNAALGRICDFVEGKITHYLLKEWNGYKILEAGNGGGIPDSDRHDYIQSTKLLTLFGKADGNFSWGLNRYKDGSGNDIECEPFGDLHSAKARLQEIVNDYKNQPGHCYDGLVRAAKDYGLAVPHDLARKAAERQLSSARSRVTEAQRGLSEAEKHLSATADKWAWAIEEARKAEEIREEPRP